MQRKPKITVLAVVLAVLTTAGVAGAGPAGAIALGAGSTLWLEGDSNVHGFAARTSTLRVGVTGDSTRPAPASAAELDALVRAGGVRGIDVDVPVTSLKSGKPALDRNLWQDLRAGEFPAIHCHLDRYAVDPVAHGDTLVVRASGVLRIAGRERPVSLVVRATPGDGGLWFAGTYALRMTDYGIKPRTMMLGAMRVRDEITVGYRLLLTGAR